MNRIAAVSLVRVLTLLAAMVLAAPARAGEIPDALTDSSDADVQEIREDDSAFLESVAVDQHDSGCSANSQCSACEACVNGSCAAQKPGGDGCTPYTPCSNGFLCLPSVATPCATECVDTECATNDDCSKCAVCQTYTGKCVSLAAGCKQDSDCPPASVCKASPLDACFSECVPLASPPDGAAGPDDGAAPADIQPRGGDSLADAGAVDAGGDVTAKPPGSPSAPSNGCSSGPRPAHGAGWLMVAALCAVRLGRRRLRSGSREATEGR